MEPCNVEYGGNLSMMIPKDAKAEMLVGQDESTYYHYIFSKRE